MTKAALALDHRAPPGKGSQGIFAWIDSYCRTHHLEKLADAVSALVLTLENPQLERRR
jgi:hypothetical protein